MCRFPEMKQRLTYTSACSSPEHVWVWGWRDYSSKQLKTKTDHTMDNYAALTADCTKWCGLWCSGKLRVKLGGEAADACILGFVLWTIVDQAVDPDKFCFRMLRMVQCAKSSTHMGGQLPRELVLARGSGAGPIANWTGAARAAWLVGRKGPRSWSHLWRMALNEGALAARLKKLCWACFLQSALVDQLWLR